MINLLKGDCLDLMKSIPDNSVDAIICDPPYGTTACKWDSVIPLDPMWEQLKRVIKPNGAIVLTASQPFTTTLIASNMGMFKYCWVWAKERGTNFLNFKHQPAKSHEDVVVFGSMAASYSKKGTMSYYPQMEEGAPYMCKQGSVGDAVARDKKTRSNAKKIETKNDGTRYPKSVQFFKTETGSHPTQKPVALMEYLIKTYTNEGETVLDFTAGSFTTGVACVNLNRKFIGIELDKSYFDIGVKRIKERIECLDLKIEPEISMVG